MITVVVEVLVVVEDVVVVGTVVCRANVSMSLIFQERVAYRSGGGAQCR